MTGAGLNRVEPDGSMVPHADLSGLGGDGFNEIVVDGRGNVYVNGGVDFHPGEGKAPGIIALVTPDGSVRQVADGIAFPNGMVVTPDNSTLIVGESFAGALTAFDIADDGGLSNRRAWAEGVGPDGISHGRRRRDLDRRRGRSATASSAASARAARCSSGSSSTGPASRACSAATTAGRCSCCGGLAHVGGLRGEHRPAHPGAAHRPGPDRPGARAGRRVAVGQSSSAIRAAARAAPSVSTGE